MPYDTFVDNSDDRSVNTIYKAPYPTFTARRGRVQWRSMTTHQVFVETMYQKTSLLRTRLLGLVTGDGFHSVYANVAERAGEGTSSPVDVNARISGKGTERNTRWQPEEF